MESQHRAQRLTGNISTPADALEKLWWNLRQFEIALSERDLGAAQSFALIDFAVASISLHAWVCDAFRSDEAKSANRIGPPLGAWLNAKIRHSEALRAIANSSKHANLADKTWRGQNAVRTYFDDESREEFDAAFNLADFGVSTLIALVQSGGAWMENELIDENGEIRGTARHVIYETATDWDRALSTLKLR